MKIIEIRIRKLHTVVDEPMPPRGDVGYSTFHHTGSEDQTVLAIELETDAGVTGITASGCRDQDAVRRMAGHFGPALLESDPADVWSTTRRLRSLCDEPGDRHIANRLEFGLWDILGKVREQPLYRLLGAGEPSSGIEVYGSALYYKPLDDVLAKARHLKDRGFRGMKLKIGHGPKEDLDLIAAVSEIVGPDVYLVLDANRAYGLDGALRLVDGLAGRNVAWFEEPFAYAASVTTPSPWSCDEVDDWGIEQYLALRRAAEIPIAGAEGFDDFSLVSRLLSSGCLDIAQPDTGNVGLLAMLAMIEMADSYGVRLTPHACCDAVGLVVSLHLQALAGAVAPQEFETFESPFVQDLFAGQREWVRPDGTVALPSAPGLGVEFDEETCSRYCVMTHSVRPQP